MASRQNSDPHQVPPGSILLVVRKSIVVPMERRTEKGEKRAEELANMEPRAFDEGKIHDNASLLLT